MQKNVITGMGHFISWLTEILVFVTIQVIVVAMGRVQWGRIHWDWFFLMLWPSINYVVFPTVQTLTSDQLRRHTFGCSTKASPPQQVEMLEAARPNNNVPLF